MANYVHKPRKGKMRRIKFQADELRDWYDDIDEFPPSAYCPEVSFGADSTVTYVPLRTARAALKRLALAVRAHLTAKLAVDELLPGQETMDYEVEGLGEARELAYATGDALESLLAKAMHVKAKP